MKKIGLLYVLVWYCLLSGSSLIQGTDGEGAVILRQGELRIPLTQAQAAKSGLLRGIYDAYASDDNHGIVEVSIAEDRMQGFLLDAVGKYLRGMWDEQRLMTFQPSDLVMIMRAANYFDIESLSEDVAFRIARRINEFFHLEYIPSEDLYREGRYDLRQHDISWGALPLELQQKVCERVRVQLTTRYSLFHLAMIAK